MGVYGAGVYGAGVYGEAGITDPRDISGLVAWYSAEAETGYADGDQMTGWTDQSGLGNHATAVGTTKPLWQATTGAGGEPAVRFGGAGYFTLPNIMGAANGEVMTQIKSDGSNCGLWAIDPGTGSSSQCHYPFAGVVYEKFGLVGGQRQSFTPTVAITSWRRYNVWSATNDWCALLDGAVQDTHTTGGAPSWSTAPVVGRGKDSSSLASFYLGHMSCLLLFNRKLTTGERADLNTWLAANPGGGAPSSGGATVSGDLALEGDVAIEGTVFLGAIEASGDIALDSELALDGVVDNATVIAGDIATETDEATDGTVSLGPLTVGGDIPSEGGVALDGSAGAGGWNELPMPPDFLLYDTIWDGAALTSFPSVAWDDFFYEPELTYEIEIDYELSADPGYLGLYADGTSGADVASIEADDWGDYAAYNAPSATGSHSLIVGPGVGDWDIHVATKSRVVVSAGGEDVRITGIRWRLAEELPPPEPVVVYDLDFQEFTLGPLVESELRSAMGAAIPSDGYYECVDIVNAGGSKQFEITIPANAVGTGGDIGPAIIYPLPESFTKVDYSFDFTWPVGVPFGLGGKLTGVGGAESGNPPSGGSGPFFNGWSMRWMWNPGGQLIGYAYHPDQPHEFGDGLETDFYLTPGVQVRLGMEVDTETGIVRFTVDGDVVYSSTFNLLDIPVTHFLMSVFRGGSGSSWAVDEDTPLLFDNFLLIGNASGADPGDGEEDEVVPPMLYLGVTDYQVDVAPGSITVTLEGGEPNDPVAVKLDGVQTQTLTLTSEGALREVSIDIPAGTAAGPHTITVHSMSEFREDLIAAFTVLVLTDAAPPPVPPAPDAAPVAVPEAVVAGTDVQRWVLQDLAPGGLGSWILPANPRTMEPLPFDRTLIAERTTDPDGLIHVTEASGRTVEWGFAGYYSTEEFQDQLAEYAQLRRRLYLIDHRNRAWMVTFTDLTFTPRKRLIEQDGVANDQTGDYDAKVTIYGTYQEPT